MQNSASRDNVSKHGPTARTSLPGETVNEIASHFWQIVEAYRPVDAVAVNAILELAICSWKFRRLFEQYVGHNAVNRLTVNEERMAREKRHARKWFRILAQDARKSLAHLESSFAGLSMIVENLENLSAELDQPEGAWTSSQFLLAVNLAGFDEHEIWDNVHLRSLWSAWFACRPGRKAAMMESQSFLPACPEYRTRARHAMENAPLPAEGRRRLLEWTGRLREAFARRIEGQGQLENELRELQPMASGWPAPEETSQHLLYLRYSNQVDRKTRELNAIIAARPSRSEDDTWVFDENMLPSDWKSILLRNRNGQIPGDLIEPQGSIAQAGSVASEMRFGVIDEVFQGDRIEEFIRNTAVDHASRSDEKGRSTNIERWPIDDSSNEPLSHHSESVELIESRSVACVESHPSTTNPRPETDFMSTPGIDRLPFDSCPVTADRTENHVSDEAAGPDHPPVEGVCVVAISIAASAPVDQAGSTDPVVLQKSGLEFESGQMQSETPRHRQTRRRLRKDKAADVRKGRHLHPSPRDARPLDPLES